MSKHLPRLAAVCLLLLSCTALMTGQNWSAPQVFPTNTFATAPSVSVNATGTAALIWADGPINNSMQVHAAVRQNGAWGTPAQLSSAGLFISGVRIAVAPNSDVLAVWRSGFMPYAVTAAFYSHGTWNTPAVISTPGLDAGMPEFAFDSQSNATLVWEQRTGGTQCVTQAIVGTVAGFGPPQTVLNACYGAISLAVNSSGQAMVVSGAPANQSGPVIAVDRNAGGVWGTPVTVASTQYRQRMPQVGLGDEGTAVVVWSQRSMAAYAKRSPAGSWFPATPLFTNNYGGTVTVAVDSFGNAVASFNKWVDNGQGIVYPAFASYMPARLPLWMPPTQIVADTTWLKVAASPRGSFVVAWSNAFTNGASTRSATLPIWKNATLGQASLFDVAAAPGTAILAWGGDMSQRINVSTETVP